MANYRIVRLVDGHGPGVFEWLSRVLWRHQSHAWILSSPVGSRLHLIDIHCSVTASESLNVRISRSHFWVTNRDGKVESRMMNSFPAKLKWKESLWKIWVWFNFWICLPRPRWNDQRLQMDRIHGETTIIALRWDQMSEGCRITRKETNVIRQITTLTFCVTSQD
jgi:hypothetical protein